MKSHAMLISLIVILLLHSLTLWIIGKCYEADGAF